MQEIDIALLLQEEATQNQYIFNFVLMNLIFVVAYVNRKKKLPEFITWLLLIVFVLYAFWDTDYFSFRHIFYTSLEGFRDPLYYYLSILSFKSYTIFRLLIWGTALLLFYKTSRRFNLPSNYTAFIFAIFFLLTFSYARVSLGMALYFYGLSFVIKPSTYYRVESKVWGLLFICLSYLGHRSLVALILLTPLSLLKLDRQNFKQIAVFGTIIGIVTARLISGLMTGDISLGENMGAVGEAADKYANITVEMTYNWKFSLMRNLRFFSIYIACAYIVWKTIYSDSSKYISIYIKKLSTFCIGLLIFSVSFLTVPSWGADIISYRYLYMLGIPLCLIITYLATNGFASYRTIILLLILAFLYSEGFIFGKILSF